MTKKRAHCAHIIRAAVVLSLMLPTTSKAALTEYKILSVGDGDTLTVMGAQGRRTIRLACIDAPETAQSPYGQASRSALQQLAPIGTEITVKAGDTDRYGRTVAELWRGSTNINLSLVQQGQAFVYRQYLKSPCSPSVYLGAERQAEAARRGVWSVPAGITRPWDFRRGRSASPPGGTSSAPSSARRYTCGGIGDYARAQQLLKAGHTYLDRDKDGEACESLR